MSDLIKHLKTVNTHRKYVMQACFKMGIPWQGLIHDLSKYSITELKIAKYYTGTKSPHQRCRELIGYSPSWMHHYRSCFGKHHYEHWLDDDENGNIIPIKMPYKYVIESFCDMVGAGKAYMKDSWTKESPWDYYTMKCENKRIMNNYSMYLLKKLLWNLHESDSVETFYQWYKSAKNYLKENYEKNNINY